MTLRAGAGEVTTGFGHGYWVPNGVVFEPFEDGAVVLDLCTRTSSEVGPCERWVLENVSECVGEAELVARFTQSFPGPDTTLQERLLEACDTLVRRRYVRTSAVRTPGGMMTSTYIQNPDVNLREEDADGALLYNPDADRVRLLNPTGTFIWKLLERQRPAEEVVAQLAIAFDDVPEEEVVAHVDEFIEEMVQGGFLCVVEARQ